MNAPRFEFLFELHSPYSYLAATQMAELERRVGLRALWTPVLLAGVFKATANRSPASNALKARYMFIDLHRWAERYQVPFQMPAWFPGNSLSAMRACTAAFTHSQALGRRLTMACFKAAWVEGIDMSLPEALTEVANMAGLPGTELLRQARSDEIKDLLRANTDRAVALGTFGAPVFLVDDEFFFGNDRMDMVEEALIQRLPNPIS